MAASSGHGEFLRSLPPPVVGDSVPTVTSVDRTGDSAADSGGSESSQSSLASSSPSPSGDRGGDSQDASTVSESPFSEPRGTARDVLAEPDYRRVFFAAFLSNTGRWMHNIATGVLAWELTESSAFLGFMIFASMIPMSLLSLVGGSLADTANRKTILLVTQGWQMFWAFVLAALVIDDHIAPALLAGIAFIGGLSQGIYAPTFTSVLPGLAGPGNISAAISLNSTQTNASRIIGPAIGGWLVSRVGFAEVFAINGITYVAVLWALWVTPIANGGSAARSLSDRLLGGFRIAKRAPQVGRPLLIMTLFTLFCLPFIGQLPAIAELNLGVDAKSEEYGWFYALFGVGALIGALLVGTLLVNVPHRLTARVTLLGFAASLAWLSQINTLSVALGAIVLVGMFYFVMPTTMATLWQEHVKDEVRGRVAALWVLSFGGMIPFSNLIAGQIIEATSLPSVMLAGSVAAVVLAFAVRLRTGPVVGDELAGADAPG